MKELNLHVENWSMLDFTDKPEQIRTYADLSALADDISNAIISDSFCDLNDHEYTH
jgi:methylaspartate ammonia-lyase